VCVCVCVQVDMVNRTTDIDLSNYVENGEWQLHSITVTRNVVYYACCSVKSTSLSLTSQHVDC